MIFLNFYANPKSFASFLIAGSVVKRNVKFKICFFGVFSFYIYWWILSHPTAQQRLHLTFLLFEVFWQMKKEIFFFFALPRPFQVFSSSSACIYIYIFKSFPFLQSSFASLTSHFASLFFFQSSLWNSLSSPFFPQAFHLLPLSRHCFFVFFFVFFFFSPWPPSSPTQTQITLTPRRRHETRTLRCRASLILHPPLVPVTPLQLPTPAIQTHHRHIINPMCTLLPNIISSNNSSHSISSPSPNLQFSSNSIFPNRTTSHLHRLHKHIHTPPPLETLHFMLMRLSWNASVKLSTLHLIFTMLRQTFRKTTLLLKPPRIIKSAIPYQYRNFRSCRTDARLRPRSLITGLESRSSWNSSSSTTTIL